MIAAQNWRAEFGDIHGLREYEELQARAGIVERWPRELAQPILQRVNDAWAQTAKPPNWREFAPLREAVQFAEAIARELATLKLEMVSGDVELCELAQRCAGMCERYPDASEFITRRVGIEPPDGKHMADEGKRLRMQDARWWRRNLRRHFGQAVENAMRSRGLVRRGRAAYCTDWALRRRQSQKARMRATLQEAIAVNEGGEQFSLFELAEKSVSNPAIRRAELMTRIAGFERIADDCGHVGIFGTQTAPSAFHPQLHAGAANPAYNGGTVRDAQKWLRQQWDKVRSKFERLSIQVYGFRIAEPHHDGTPHWHLLLFTAAHEVQRVCTIIREYWCSDYKHELTNGKARKARCFFKRIDKAKGSAAGYVAKYVAKNIDGFQVGDDHEAGEQSDSTAHRVEAWASTHRIRQFQQVGGAPVGLWRELRRIRSGCDVAAIENARQLADAGDWAGFAKLVSERRDNAGAGEGAGAVALWKEQSDEPNTYREPRQPQTVGVQSMLERVRTRVHEWRINWSGSCSTNARSAEKSALVCISEKSGANATTAADRSVSGGDAQAPSSLGPVSITVRDPKNFDRGDGSFIYQSGGRWFLHRAISRAGPVFLPKLNPAYQFVQSVTYPGALSCSR